MTLPGRYERAGGGTAVGFARRGDAAWVAGVLRDGGTLHDWAARRTDVRTLQGRGAVHVVRAPDGASDAGAHYAVRHYRRGGWMGPLLDDRYLAVGAPRPVAELHASEAVRRRGIPTPEVVAGAVYPDGMFYRADLVTRLVPGADLAALLWGDETFASAETALETTGRFVRTLEAAGVDHPDLNARNILLSPGGAGPEPWLLDLDRCRVLPDGRAADGAALRSRLRRSLRKIGQRRGRPLGRDAWAALSRGFGDAS